MFFRKSPLFVFFALLTTASSHILAQATPQDTTIGVSVYATTSDVERAVDKAILKNTYKLPFFEIPLAAVLPEAYKKVYDFLKKNPSAQNLNAFALKNPKFAIFLGITSFVGIYALAFHGLSVFTKRSKKTETKNHDDQAIAE